MTMVPGELVQIGPLVRRVLCDNPSVFTGPGTNTYLVGPEEGGDLAVIDPGPDDEAHLDRIAEFGAGRIRWILVTHTHSDHSPGAAGLKARTGAEAIGFDARDGFIPDRQAGEGFTLGAAAFDLRALHTPGHASNHLCYLLDDQLLFSGDHLMNGSTVVIAPPDGDMAAYLSALRRLSGMPISVIAPGHGERIDDPRGKIDEYVTHRLAREEAVATALAVAQRATVDELVEAVYVDVAPAMHPIARFSLWAHLRKLAEDGRVAAADPDDIETMWEALAPDRD